MGRAKSAEHRTDGIRPAPLAGEELALKIASIAVDKKAESITVLDVRGLTTYVDYFVILGGTSDRQVVALSDAVVRALKEVGTRPSGVEGTETGTWVLVDYGDVIVHAMHEDARTFYDLEGLWADAPRLDVPGAPEPRGF